jgi:predicted ester cyclase
MPVKRAPPGAIDLAGYASVPEYIYGITREIWEDRGVGAKLERYYAPDVVVRSPAGVVVGNAGVVGQTLATLHQFPDRQLVGEDVIWAGEDDGTFLSSHRLISVMTHTGDGALGRASGRAVRARIIADCWVKNGQVTEEWLVRDQAAFALCLGESPQELALRWVREELAAGAPVGFFTPAQDRPSRYRPGISSDPAVAPYLSSLHRIWGEKTPAAVREHYFSGATVYLPGGAAAYGHSDIDRFVVSYLAAFPSATFEVHSVIVNRAPEHAVRLAVRWSLEGAHSGHGRFGAPSGARVHIMGLSHVWLSTGRVLLEWWLVDEVSIWKQIHAHRLEAGAA